MRTSIRHAVVFAGLLALLGVPAGATALAGHQTAAHQSPGVQGKAMLREAMRKLWTDHVVWTLTFSPDLAITYKTTSGLFSRVLLARNAGNP